MNKIVLIIILLASTITAQEKNKIFIDSKSRQAMLVGLCDREAFVDTNFAWWFNSGYKFYHPDTVVVAKIMEVNTDYSITIVMGTWCSDSRKEVPRFYKLLDELNFSEEKATLINVNRKKDGIDTDVTNLNIELVPTFIVYSNGKEIGRIIETPKKSLEKDFLEIISEI